MRLPDRYDSMANPSRGIWQQGGRCSFARASDADEMQFEHNIFIDGVSGKHDLDTHAF